MVHPRNGKICIKKNKGTGLCTDTEKSQTY